MARRSDCAEPAQRRGAAQDRVPCVLFRAVLFVAATAAFARDLDLARALFLRSRSALVLTTLGSEFYGIARATCFLEIVFKLII